MKLAIDNQRGSVLIMSLLVLVVLGGMLVAASPMIVNEVKMNTVNRDMIDAQFAAEAGAKVGIAAVYAKNTDWSWLGSSRNLVNGNATKTYSVTISPAPPADGKLISGQAYVITSTGTVNNAIKKVIVNVTPGGASNVFTKYSSFSNGKIDINGTVNIIGDLASNSSVDLNWSKLTFSDDVYGPAGSVKYKNRICGGIPACEVSYDALPSPETLDVASLIPAMPTFSMTGTNLTSTWTSGQWGGSTYTLTASNYFYNGNYNLNGHNYNIPAGTTTTIYINGKLNIMSGYRITGGGNLIIYAKDGVQLSGGYIDVGSSGSVGIYTPNALEINKDSYINGQTVTVLAQKSTSTLNGGSINATLAGAVTKIYTENFTINNSSSIISGNGAGMVVAIKDISITAGSAENTIFVAGGNISAKASISTVVGGLYANGTISISELTMKINPDVVESLALSTPGADSFTINSWGK